MLLDKYELSKTLDTLSDEGKQLVARALQEAEQHITRKTIQAHWKEVVIGITCIACIFMYYEYRKMRTQLDQKTAISDQLKKIDSIDAQLKFVQINQNEVYPKLDETMAKIEQARSQLQNATKAIKAVNEEQIRKHNAALSSQQISKGFTDLGYPNSVLIDPKGGAVK